MQEESLYFSLNECIQIKGKNYIVEGKVNYLNETDGCNWTEYKLIEQSKTKQVRWLSVDMVYHEYAIYQVSNIQNASEIERRGYHLVDEGIAKVMDMDGDVDVSYAKPVRFKEYEDVTEEKIISIEEWEDEIEYSTGYYLDAHEIKQVDTFNDAIKTVSKSGNYGYKEFKEKEKSRFAKSIIIFIILLWIGLPLLGKGFNIINNVNLTQSISKNSQFTYVTSITADIDNTQKADIYETNLTIEEAAKTILRMAGKSVVNVDENIEDGTVAIITKGYYCLVYQDEDGKVLVQVSSRKYVYSSRQSPYRSRTNTYNFYRSYYYSRAYMQDYDRYGKSVSAYESYSGPPVGNDETIRYKVYSDTIKQESTASRSSSGGGTSSGK